MTGTTDIRRQELSRRLDAVQRRISVAAAEAGRAEPPQLIVVTKFFPASDVRILAELGVTQVGENRDQEASGKAAETADLDLAWHYIGQLQTNKAKSVVRYADVVHSADRPQLITALAKAMAREQARRQDEGQAARKALTVLIQVDLDERPMTSGGADGTAAAEVARGGAAPDVVLELAAQIEGSEGLELGGVMAVAPLGGDPDLAFSRLYEISQRLQQRYPGANMISAGMSGDLEHAVAHGATHLRIGSDVLGPRAGVR